MPTIHTTDYGLVVRASDARGTYHYLADSLGTPTEGGWTREEDAMAALEGDGPEPDFAIDIRGRRGLEALAGALGMGAAADYVAEFGSRPAPGREGDWDVTAWTGAWTELEHQGATRADHDGCLEAWRDSFYHR
jgi:hypothetical protein